MANLDAPHGFVPVQAPAGNDIPTQEFTVTDSVAVYPGQILYMVAAGTVQAYSGTATGRLALIGAALDYVGASATDRKVGVSVSPDQQYSVQTDDNSIDAIDDCLGANFAGLNLSTANTTKLISSAEIDGSSASITNNSTVNNPFQCVRVMEGAENVLAQTYANIVVRIRPENHLFSSAAAI
jgi:hypothetical protein